MKKAKTALKARRKPAPGTSATIKSFTRQSMFWLPDYLEQSSWVEHIPFAFWLVDVHRPRVLVELGTHYGVSYFAFCQAAERLGLDVRCFAVDTWRGDAQAGSYGEAVFDKVREYNSARYQRFSTLLRGTFDEAVRQFADGSIDLLHIDGLHTFEAVLHDFETWRSKLSPRGVVIMHDTAVRDRDFGVYKVFASLAGQYPHFSFEHGSGLGVVGVGSKQVKLLRDLFAAESHAPVRAALHETFASLGRSCAELNKALYDKDVHIGNLERILSDREARLGELTNAVQDKDVHIGNLERILSDREGRLGELANAVHDKDVHIGNLEQIVSDREVRLGELTRAVQDKDVHIGNLERILSDREGRLGELTNAVQDKDVHIGNLERILSDREGRLGELTNAVHDKDVHIGNLEQIVSDREVRLGELTRAVQDKDVHIGNLERAAAEGNERIDALTRHNGELTRAVQDKEAHIGNLARAVAERDERVEALTRHSSELNKALQQVHVASVQSQRRIRQLRAGIGWKLFKPARMATAVWRRIVRRIPLEPVPLAQVRRSGGRWIAEGDDPQILLMADRAWSGLAGWYWLELDVRSDKPMEAEVYLDLGDGFDPTWSLRFVLAGNGRQRIPLFIPVQCRHVRLDPCSRPAEFVLSGIRMIRLRESPQLPPDLAEQAAVYEALGAREGNVEQLDPCHGIRRSENTAYTWRTEIDDPWFLLSGIRPRLRPGWLLMELRIRSNNERGMAKMYFDFGKGFSELDSVVMPFSSGETIARVYPLMAAPRKVRLDPLEASGWFSVHLLRFTMVPQSAARERMLQRLSGHAKKYRGRTVASIWRDIEQEAAGTQGGTAEELLLERYSKTFPVIYGPRGAVSYEDWIAKFETPDFSDAASIERAQASFASRPTISVLMPTYNTEVPYLRRAIESVLAQSYPNWELCIADDASPEPHVRSILEEYGARDRRIRIAYRTENGHISAASNSALEMATGEYVALLDHDDELAPHALHFVTEAVNGNPSAQIFYSDEDKIDDIGLRMDPHFKPDWNPDLFCSQNYLSHLGVYRRDLLEKIGGFRVGREGSQDQDLVLRCLPHAGPGEIVHIPRVLYHWRMQEGSTAWASAEKDYTLDAGLAALRDHFEQQGRSGVIAEPGLMPNTYHVRYPLPDPPPLVSLLIPTRDMLVVLKPCVHSILEKTSYGNFEIIILDNESVESATIDFFRQIQAQDRRVEVVPYHQPFNFSAINNFGVRAAAGTVIGLVNNDVEVISPDWLSEMVRHALRPEIGCVGAKLYYDDDTIQHAGVIVGLGGVAGHSHKYARRVSSGYFHRLMLVQNLSAVTAACLVVRKEVYEQVGGLDESLRIAFNDVDFCLKVREAGYRNLWTPYAELYHHESKSRGMEDSPEKVERFNGEIAFMKSKWGAALERDPYYSPNLTLSREDFSLR